MVLAAATPVNACAGFLRWTRSVRRLRRSMRWRRRESWTEMWFRRLSRNWAWTRKSCTRRLSEMDINLPNLGEGADAGTIVNLFVEEGDQIAKDQPLLELENEKAVATIPSTAAGKVTKIFVKSGDKISVGQRILSLSEMGEAVPEKGAKVNAVTKPKALARLPQEAPAGQEAEDERPNGAVSQPKPGIAPAAAPSIRKLARELGIDLTGVRGSESGGRIVRADLHAYIQDLQSRP